MFEYTSKLDWPAVRSIAMKYNATIAQLTPHLHRELEGIAFTAEVDLLDIVALNCRSEIALGEFSDGCTSLAWKVEEQNTMYLAQNWDWVKVVGDNLVLMTIKQEGKPEIRMVTEVNYSSHPNSLCETVLTRTLGWDSWQDRIQHQRNRCVLKRNPCPSYRLQQVAYTHCTTRLS